MHSLHGQAYRGIETVRRASAELQRNSLTGDELDLLNCKYVSQICRIIKRQ